MPKYLVLYHADVSAEQQMQQSPEEGQAEMQEWMAWAESAGQAIVDLGTPLGNGRTVGGSGAGASSSSTVAGYSMLDAADADAAAALMQSHPHLKTGTIEVLEALEIPGM
ncbi:YciI family protein [Agrococcus beijingensis]|uniref:YciI family protein n=1 Tax=Agrococcus beijingensis TaxID=3068634 RepID=UPI00274144A1|nr:YciI family protein [Agrococcus sp. REN33]